MDTKSSNGNVVNYIYSTQVYSLIIGNIHVRVKSLILGIICIASIWISQQYDLLHMSQCGS